MNIMYIPSAKGTKLFSLKSVLVLAENCNCNNIVSCKMQNVHEKIKDLRILENKSNLIR